MEARPYSFRGGLFYPEYTPLAVFHHKSMTFAESIYMIIFDGYNNPTRGIYETMFIIF